MPAPQVATAQDAHDALQAVKDALDDEYEKAPPGALSRDIDQRLDKIDPVLTALNQADMASRTIDLQAAAATMQDPLKRLDQLKSDIQGISNDLAKAAQVLGTVDEVLGDVKALFGI